MSSPRKEILRAYFSKLDGHLDPILTSLNGDNSWMISFPVPRKVRDAKAYYHVVSDAWLQGAAVTLSSWLVWIGLAAPAAFTTGDAINSLVQEIEDEAAAAGLVSQKDAAAPKTIDAIFSNFHYADHLSEPTMRTFSREIPVFATAESEIIIRGWNHFDNIVLQKDLNADSGDWQLLHPGTPLPEWLSVFRLVGHHELNFATAMVWSTDSNNHEAILYSPHGIKTDQPTLQTFTRKTTPPLEVRAILHALKDSFAFGKRTTLGVEGGLALEEETNAKYWIQSHDSALDYQGVVLRLGVRDYARTLENGIQEILGRGGTEAEKFKGRKLPTLIAVDNGGSFVLH